MRELEIRTAERRDSAKWLHRLDQAARFSSQTFRSCSCSFLSRWLSAWATMSTLTILLQALIKRRVTGPGTLLPILKPFTLCTGTIVGLVPTRKASSALYRSYGVKSPSLTLIPRSLAIGKTVARVLPPRTVLSVGVQSVPFRTKKKLAELVSLRFPLISSISGRHFGSTCLASKSAILWFILLVIFAFDSKHWGGIRLVDGMTSLTPSMRCRANSLKLIGTQ